MIHEAQFCFLHSADLKVKHRKVFDMPPSQNRHMNSLKSLEMAISTISVVKALLENLQARQKV